ncbi:MAG: hypothetical protein R6V86_11280 [Spirochaetia bacterium]
MLCILMPVASVEGARVENHIFLPPDFYVGDNVEMRLRVYPESGLRVLPPEEVPVTNWIDIHDVRVKQDGLRWEVQIDFTSYAPGTRTLPVIQLGDVVLNDVKLHTKSILQERGLDFFGIKGQLYLPGTRLAIGLAVLILFFGPVFVLSFAGRVTQGVKRFVSIKTGRRPYKRFMRALKDLREKHMQMSSRRFYIVLSEELRHYLSSRTKDDFIALTSSELHAQLWKTLPSDSTEQVEALVRMMQQSDEIKFGGLNASKKQREEDLEMVVSAAKEIEVYIETVNREAEKQKKQKRRRASK